MFFKRFSVISNFLCRHSVCLLAIIWTVGLLIGMLLAGFDAFRSLDLVSVHIHASYFQILVVTSIPFLCSLVAVLLKLRSCVFLFSLSEGVCVGFFLTKICFFSVTAGWIYVFFFMFSRIFTFPLLFLFWNTRLHNSMQTIFRSFAFCCLCVIVVSFFDATFVAPLFSVLINHF